MDSLPDVSTVRSILSEIVIKGDKLNKDQIDKLTRLKLGTESMFTLKDRDFILETIGFIQEYGFEYSYKYLKSSQKENSREIIIKRSPVYDSYRKKIFLDITKDLRATKVESHTQCPRCKQYHVDTISKQTRSADEGATDYHKCSDCSYQWKE